MNSTPIRDAIVYSGWTWETYNVPERIALALAQLGCKVLYCEAPVSPLRTTPRPRRQLEGEITSLQVAFLSSRVNRLPIARNLQAKAVSRQIEREASRLGLRDPIFIYSYMDDSTALCREMKKKHFIVHICMDHSNSVAPDYDSLVEVSELTLAIPKSSFHRLKARFGDKVYAIPQVVDLTRLRRAVEGNGHEPAALAAIPRPRLGFFGNVRNLNQRLLQSILEARPQWQFVSAGANIGHLPNAHALPWTNLEGLAGYTQNVNVGFMPYNCYDEERLHCVPLKLFEYFAFGIPVVSTPLIHLWEYKDLIYFGDTTDELINATEQALDEPSNSPKRLARMKIAGEHSLENLASALWRTLPLQNGELR